MKKIPLFLAIMSTLLFADFPKMNTLLSQQSAIATAVNGFMRDRGTIPTDITALKNANYLLASFDETNSIDGDSITFSVGSNEVVVNSQIEVTKTDAGQEDYYINSASFRELGRISKIISGKLVSYYSLGTKSAFGLQVDGLFGKASYKGDLAPEQYSTISNGNYWFSSTFRDNMYQLYLRDNGTWSKVDSSDKNLDTNGNFVNLATIDISKSFWETSEVGVLTTQVPIECLNGATYSGSNDRCEAYTSNACDYGYIWNSTRSRCELSPTCAVGYTYDAVLNKCKKVTTITAITTNTVSFTIKKTNGGQNVGSYVTSAELSGYYDDYAGEDSSTSTAYTVYSSGAIKKTNGGQNVGSYVTSAELSGYYDDYAGGDSYDSTAYTISSSTTTNYSCPSGYTLSGTLCYATVTATATCLNGTLDGVADVCYRSSTCDGKIMSVTPFYPTLYNGNNGVCYSDAGLYCKSTGGLSWDGIYTCWDNTEKCPDATYNLRYDTDLCEKFDFSCGASLNRYGLSTSPTNGNSTDLYNRIILKDDKLNAVAPVILVGDVDVNDNLGAMCTELKYNDFIQPSISPTYNIGGDLKSGF